VGTRLASILGATAIACSPTVLAAPASAATPLRLVGSAKLSPRLEQLSFRTPAVNGITRVRVLLPRGYAQHRGRRYPVLYLLHGAIDNFSSWTDKGDAAQLTLAYPMIVVMPDSGPDGGYTNWYNGGRGGPPQWETYHIDQLLPWIDGHLRTIPTRAERAIAGLSMGGYGAIDYAARHPDLFAAAASFSGALDTNNPGDIAVTPPATYGPRSTEQLNWRARNPLDLARNLRGVNLTLRTGNGQPGGPFGGGDVVETVVHQMNVAFHDRLQQLRIPSIWNDYGPGGHDWPYWRRDLRQTLPWLLRRFEHPKPPPSSFTYTDDAPRYKIYGWSATLRRRALEFSTLTVSGRRGFSLTGSGSATVSTRALFRAGRSVKVLVRDAAGVRTRRLTTDSSGRIAVTVSLGPSNRYRQYSVQADRTPRHTVTATVQFAVARADERGASLYLEHIRSNPALLHKFLLAMPKGGDLHMHLSGAVYAEAMLRFGAEANDCVNVSTSVATLPPCKAHELPIADAKTDAKLRNRIIDAWSMRGYTGPNGHNHFFDSFAKFDVTLNGRNGDALASVAERAFSQNELYIEPLDTPSSADVDAIAKKVRYTRNFARLRQRLLQAGLRDVLPKAIAYTNGIFEQKRRADPNPFPVIRLDFEVGRVAPPVVVFTRLLFAFELMRADHRWVGVNLDEPEDNPIALRDYTLQMGMLHYLRGVYPVGHITLHAGELVPGRVPWADLRFHIRQAVQIGDAERIGHGVDIVWENNRDQLANQMARHHIDVEINLTSNQQILGVNDRAQLALYLGHHVPISLSTDDEGVERTTLTGEYERAVRVNHLDYLQLKASAEHSIRYAFVQAAEKARLEADLARSFRRFEARYASRRQGLG
jgi:S-formylglutathione hydrolase FrmB